MGYPSSRHLGLTWVDGEVTGITLGGTPLITQIEWTPFAGTVKRWGWAMASGTKANERYFDLAGRAIRYPLGEALRDVRYDEASRIVSFKHLGAAGAGPGVRLRREQPADRHHDERGELGDPLRRERQPHRPEPERQPEHVRRGGDEQPHDEHHEPGAQPR